MLKLIVQQMYGRGNSSLGDLHRYTLMYASVRHTGRGRKGRCVCMCGLQDFALAQARAAAENARAWNALLQDIQQQGQQQTAA